MIRYSSIAPNSHVDGPGSRTVVFLQGCSIGCRGCQNKHLWPAPGGKLEATLDLALAIMDHANPNITISGGEPTDQLSELWNLLYDLRENGAKHIVVYTGRTWEQLQSLTDGPVLFEHLLPLIDILVDGPFILERDDPLITWRGSRNQRPIDVRATLATGDLVVLDWSRPEIVIDGNGNLHLPAGLASGFQPAGDLMPSRRCGQTRS